MLLRNPEPEIDSSALKNIRFVVRRAIKSSRAFRRHEEDDLVQECAIWLLDRIDRFDPSRASWSTFCRMVAEACLSNRKSRRKRQLKATSMHLNHQSRRGQDYVPEQVATLEHSHNNRGKVLRPETELRALQTDVKGHVDKLPTRLREVCLVYLSSPNTCDAAERLSLSRTTV